MCCTIWNNNNVNILCILVGFTCALSLDNKCSGILYDDDGVTANTSGGEVQIKGKWKDDVRFVFTIVACAVYIPVLLFITHYLQPPTFDMSSKGTGSMSTRRVTSIKTLSYNASALKRINTCYLNMDSGSLLLSVSFTSDYEMVINIDGTKGVALNSSWYAHLFKRLYSITQYV
jgi:hypothetical protein